MVELTPGYQLILGQLTSRRVHHQVTLVTSSHPNTTDRTFFVVCLAREKLIFFFFFITIVTLEKELYYYFSLNLKIFNFVRLDATLLTQQEPSIGHCKQCCRAQPEPKLFWRSGARAKIICLINIDCTKVRLKAARMKKTLISTTIETYFLCFDCFSTF